MKKDKEVTIANQKHKPMFQIQPQKQNYGGIDGAGDIIPWKWDKIDAKINELLGQA